MLSTAADLTRAARTCPAATKRRRAPAIT